MRSYTSQNSRQTDDCALRKARVRHEGMMNEMSTLCYTTDDDSQIDFQSVYTNGHEVMIRMLPTIGRAYAALTIGAGGEVGSDGPAGDAGDVGGGEADDSASM